jgi:hypothetical protein
MIVKKPSWMHTDYSTEDLNRIRQRLVFPAKLTIAVRWGDGLWYLVRVERVDRRAHEISFGGEGGEYGKVRLIGYENEKGLIPFVVLVKRDGLDAVHGTLYILLVILPQYGLTSTIEIEVVAPFGPYGTASTQLSDDVVREAMKISHREEVRFFYNTVDFLESSIVDL